MTTMLSEQPSKTTLGVGFDAHSPRTAGNTQEAWRRAIGTKPVAAPLEKLPAGKPTWDRFGGRLGAPVVVVGLALLAPLLYPEKIRPALNMEVVSLATPPTEI